MVVHHTLYMTSHSYSIASNFLYMYMYMYRIVSDSRLNLSGWSCVCEDEYVIYLSACLYR